MMTDHKMTQIPVTLIGGFLVAGKMQAFDGVTTVLDLEAGRLPVGEFYAELKDSVMRKEKISASLLLTVACVLTVVSVAFVPSLLLARISHQDDGPSLVL